MRIISGLYKGRGLASLKGRMTRPTRDRVREAIFNILEPDGPFLMVADLFAGTGAMGLEAISRWQGRAVFVETSPAALECLRENIRRLEVGEKVSIIPRDLSRGAGFLLKNGAPFDLIFLDPPYGRGLCRPIVTSLLSLPILAERGTAVLEHDLQEPIPPRLGDWQIGDQRRYGQTRVTFYKSS
jgi:16S rRNA (guanine(966)-N(2))-methyltransferase RsmD